jgi:hypothetical protein
MKKKSPLKKHSYWVLFGVVPLIVFLAVILIWTGVGSAISAEEAKIKASNDEMAKAKPNGKGIISKLSEQQKQLEETRTQLWKANYDRQVAAKVFAWPTPANMKELKDLEARHPRFGEELKATIEDEFEKFTRNEVYLEGYKKLAESVGPTRFGLQGGWPSVLRFVSDWSKLRRPDSALIWLALEDYWVQKALLDPIRQVNESVSAFHLQTLDENKRLVPYDASKKLAEPPPLERTFVSRNWELELKVMTDNNKRVIKSRLKNRTERLQLLGIGKTMKLRIWLDDPAVSQPIDYKIEGELVKGLGELDVKLVPKQHEIPLGTTPIKITKVEQVLDELTVPVRLILDVQIGALDHKRQSATLLPPDFIPTDEAVPTTPTPGAEGPMGIPGVGPGRLGEGPGGPGVMGGRKYGTPEEVLLGNKARYLDKTSQVRRIPVGMTLVLDQAYINDVLVAFANSPLRFQITQTQWTRFRDPIPLTPETPPGTGTGGEGPGGVVVGGGGPMGIGGGGPMGIGGGGPMGIGGGGPLTPGSGPGGPLGQGSPESGQVSAGLVEFGLYGIVSLYERYAAPPAETPTDGNPTPTPMP